MTSLDSLHVQDPCGYSRITHDNLSLANRRDLGSVQPSISNSALDFSLLGESLILDAHPSVDPNFKGRFQPQNKNVNDIATSLTRNLNQLNAELRRLIQLQEPINVVNGVKNGGERICNFIEWLEENIAWHENLLKPLISEANYQPVQRVVDQVQVTADWVKPTKLAANFTADAIKLGIIITARVGLAKITKKFHDCCEELEKISNKDDPLYKEQIEQAKDLKKRINAIASKFQDLEERTSKNIGSSFFKLGEQMSLILAKPISVLAQLDGTLVRNTLKGLFNLIKGVKTWNETSLALHLQEKWELSLQPTQIGDSAEIEKRQKELEEFYHSLEKSETSAEIRSKLNSFNIDLQATRQFYEELFKSLEKCKTKEKALKVLKEYDELGALSVSFVRDLQEAIDRASDVSLKEFKETLKLELKKFIVNTKVPVHPSDWKNHLGNHVFKEKLDLHIESQKGLARLTTPERLQDTLNKRRLLFTQLSEQTEPHVRRFLIDQQGKTFAEIQQNIQQEFGVTLTAEEWETQTPVEKLQSINPPRKCQSSNDDPSTLVEQSDIIDPVMLRYLAEQLVKRTEAMAMMVEKGERVSLLQKIKLERIPIHLNRAKQIVDIILTIAQLITNIPYVGAVLGRYLSQWAVSKVLFNILSFDLTNIPYLGFVFLLFTDLETIIANLIKQGIMVLIGYLVLRHIKPNLYSLEAFKLELEKNGWTFVKQAQKFFYSLAEWTLYLVVKSVEIVKKRILKRSLESDATYLQLNNTLQACMNHKKEKIKRLKARISILEDQLQAKSLEDFKQKMSPQGARQQTSSDSIKTRVKRMAVEIVEGTKAQNQQFDPLQDITDGLKEVQSMAKKVQNSSHDSSLVKEWLKHLIHFNRANFAFHSLKADYSNNGSAVKAQLDTVFALQAEESTDFHKKAQSLFVLRA